MRKCSNCGTESPDEARFCAQCGVGLPLLAAETSESADLNIPTAQVVAASPASSNASSTFSGVGEPPTSALAIVSLISGVLGWVALPCVGAATAVVTGHMARKEVQASQGRAGGAGLAMVGLVLGYAQVALLCLVLTLAGALFAVGGKIKDSLMETLDQARHGQKVEEGPPSEEEEYPDESGDADNDSDSQSPDDDIAPDEPAPPAERPGRKGNEKAY